MPTGRTISHRRSRLTFWVGATHLLLYLLGPWAHEHAHLDRVAASASGIHHAHSFAITGQGAAASAGHGEESTASHSSDTPGLHPGHSVSAHDGPAELALQSSRSATLPGPLRILPTDVLVRIDDATEVRCTRIRGNSRADHARAPSSSGHIALHQGTDVSPPRI